MTSPVHAAGGVPVRTAPEPQVLLVHRRRYGDWTFPKGKREPGESDETCALREVEEETGLRCGIVAELPSTTYAVGDRPKVVRWWQLEVLEGTLAARPGEIDEVRWVGLAEARDLLTYDHDLPVLAAVRP